ncbi:hypothetical protein MPER_12942 [Moniliophthora perniciosa FA553]|nr:hypothetical protein MPER_12942 [Moniliophthora perniciosa FA553]
MSNAEAVKLYASAFEKKLLREAYAEARRMCSDDLHGRRRDDVFKLDELIKAVESVMYAGTLIQVSDEEEEFETAPRTNKRGRVIFNPKGTNSSSAGTAGSNPAVKQEVEAMEAKLAATLDKMESWMKTAESKAEKRDKDLFNKFSQVYTQNRPSMQSSQPRVDNRPPRPDISTIKCHVCEELGHYANDCAFWADLVKKGILVTRPGTCGLVFKDHSFVPQGGDDKETQKVKILRIIQEKGWEFPLAAVHMQFATEEEDDFADEYEELKQAREILQDYAALRQLSETQGEQIKQMSETLQFLINKLIT